MDNPRADKVAIVDEVKDRLEQSSGVVVTEYRGLSVAALAELRGQLRPVGGKYKVYKNTLVRRAVDDAGVNLDTDFLVGPTALAFTEETPEGKPGDLPTVAKVLRDFAKANPDLIIKGGLFEGEGIDADGVKALADVEPREVLLAKLAGLMQAPMQKFASAMQALPRNLAYGLQALADAGGAPGAPEAVPAEAPAADDASAEAPDADEVSDAAETVADESSEATPEESNDEAAEAPAETAATSDSSESEAAETAAENLEEPTSDETAADSAEAAEETKDEE